METLNINTILIANRGEIASRVIRTCNKMGIRSIAVFSEADADAPYVKEADIAINIGGASPAESYLDQEKIITVAIEHGADAIHPGYGFLSENAGFAKKCQENNLIFIGPNVGAIETMGSKSAAKSLMQENNVPTIPGYQGKDQSLTTLKAAAIKVGFPLLLKATAGGGGKGMRIVHNESEIEAGIEAAKRESQNAFGDDELIIEKYITSGRHIEFQIFGDTHGNVIHVLERECTIQRRYQKVIEESPSPVMTEALRNEMGNAAIAAAKALDYDNAGTVEFIYDDKSGDYFFLEVNTRLQVEHPVTEEITGLDLVQMQIESAQGLPLRVSQEEVKGKGYALEVRLYAEDATNDFLPVSGKILKFQVPKVEGLRTETAIRSGSVISIYYDPMIAKLIVWDDSRQGAIRKMTYALKNLVCLGMITNQEFLLLLLENKLFQAGEYDTHFIDNEINLSEVSKKDPKDLHAGAIAATIFQWQGRDQAKGLLGAIPSGWRSNFYDYQKDEYHLKDEVITVQYRYSQYLFDIRVGEASYKVQFVAFENDQIHLQIDGIRKTFYVLQENENIYLQNEKIGTLSLKLESRFPIKEIEKVKGAYLSPMPSQVIKVLVKKGDEIKIGDPLIILSSMKMENQISAEEEGIVEEVYVEENSNIESGCVLLKVNAEG
ncbi:MAG: acetyl/propionyl-CoA carboxylase alpha subunit [Saprospiraceae bacterium]|jgi:acetyl/propionyl-CoA carboxylase alpha subunit